MSAGMRISLRKIYVILSAYQQLQSLANSSTNPYFIYHIFRCIGSPVRTRVYYCSIIHSVDSDTLFLQIHHHHMVQSKIGQQACRLIFKIWSLHSYKCIVDEDSDGQIVPSNCSETGYLAALNVRSIPAIWSIAEHISSSVVICSQQQC